MASIFVIFSKDCSFLVLLASLLFHRCVMPRAHDDCKFRDEWLVQDKYKEWVVKDGDPRLARCQFCMKSSLEVPSVMLNKSVLNYYSHFSSHFPDFFSLSRSTPQGASFLVKKNHVTLKNNMFGATFIFVFYRKTTFSRFFSAIMFYSPRRIDSDKKNHVTLNYNVF